MAHGIADILWLSGYGGLLLTAAMTDIRWLRIPNLISVLLVALFVVVAAGSTMAGRPVAWGSHVAAGALVFAVGLGLFAWGKLGGGDVKLLAAVALWHGLWLLPVLLLWVALVGGALGLLCLTVRWAGIGLFLASRGVAVVSLEDGAGIPYAVAIAAACGLLLPQLPFLAR
jgi:prepilin peptidase CpaA